MKMGQQRSKTANNATGTPSGLRFVSGRGACEEKTIEWSIENFEGFLALSDKTLRKNKNSLIFQAGTCLRKGGKKTAATWKFYFEQDGSWVGAYLKLKGSSKVKSVQASYSVSLSSGGLPITSFTVDRKEYASDPIGWGKYQMVTKSEVLQKTKATETDSLDVTLTLKVFSTNGFTPVLQAVSPSTPSDLLELRDQLIADYEKLFESGDSADILVKVPKEAGGEVDEDSYTKKVHKAVLVARSSVFAKMFAEGVEMVEALKGEVVIRDMSPKGLDIFLHYLYTGEVLDEWVKVPEEILNSAEKYDLGKLKSYCGKNLMSAVTSRNAWEMYHFAKLHNLSEALTALVEFIDWNLKAILTEGTGGQGQGE